MLTKIVFTMLLIGLSACAPKKSSEARLSVTLSGITSQLPGGLMIYARNETGAISFARRVTGTSLSLELENGSWSFSAIGWDGTQPLTGVVRCATATAKLAGDPVSIPLSLTKSNCEAPSFNAGGYFDAPMTNVQPLRVFTCSTLSGLSAAADCGGQEGLATSMRIVMPQLNGALNSPTQTGGIVSSCVPIGSAGEFAQSLRIPVGGADSLLPTQVITYVGASCSGAAETFYFPRGVHATSTVPAKDAIYDSGNETKLFLKNDLTPPAPTGITFLTPVNSLTATVTVAGTSTGASVTVFTDAACTVAVGSNIAGGGSTPVTLSLPTAGTYTLRARQSVGAVSSPCFSATGPLVVDTTPPSAPASVSWATAGYTNSTMNTLNWVSSVDTGSGILAYYVALYSDAACTTSLSSEEISGAGSTSFNFPSLSDNTYYAGVRAVDMAGNTSSVSCSNFLSVDTIAPDPATPLAWGQTSPTTASALSLFWDYSPSADLASQELVIFTGPSCDSFAFSMMLGSADTGYTYNVPADNTYTFRVRSFDVAGNATYSSCSSSMVVDRIALGPSAITNVVPGTPVGNVTAPQIMVSGVEVGASVQLFINPSCTTAVSSTTTAGATNVMIVTDPLVDGTYLFYARQIDAAGNVSPCVSALQTYELDTVAPALPTILGVKGTGDDTFFDNMLMDFGNARFGWNFQADVATYEIQILDNLAALACGPLSISGALDEYTFTPCVLANNTVYEFQIRAVDTAGNTSSFASLRFAKSWLTDAPPVPGGARDKISLVELSSKLCFWGGIEAGNFSNTGRCFDPALNTWSPITATGAPAMRARHATVISNSEMYIIGGDTGGAALNTVSRYNGVSWFTLSTLPIGRSEMIYGVDPVTMRILIWGGRSNASTLVPGNGHHFNGSAWNSVSNAPPISNRYQSAYVVHASKLFVWGGGDLSATVYGDGAKYDFMSTMWDAPALSTINAPSARKNMAFTKVDNKLFIWGGEDGLGNKFNDGAIYNMDTDTWTPLPALTLSVPAMSHSMATSDGTSVYVWGGIAAGNINTPAGFIYHPATNTYSMLTPQNAPLGVVEGSFKFFQGRFYMVGGRNTGDSAVNDVKAFGPPP